MGRWFAILGTVYLVAMAAFLAGVYITHARVWPFPLLKEAYLFVKGHADESTSILEKLSNDAGIRPERFIFDYKPRRTPEFRELAEIPVRSRRLPPLIRTSSALPPGYVYVVGKFDFEEGMNGVLLFDTRGVLVRRWIIPDRDNRDAHHHPFDFRPDGSFLSGADYASLYHIDRCGEERARISGVFHHSLSQIDDDRYWVTGSVADKNAISVFDISSFSVEKSVLLEDIHDKAAEILSLFRVSYSGVTSDDPWHNNDVEPLPAGRSGDAFDAGDLLISYRHANLTYVLDPDDLNVKWWTRDYLAGPHDPDWGRDGDSVTVYNNRALGLHGGYSTIERYRPGGGAPEILLDGRDYDFYSGIGGKHTVFEDGSLITLAYEQGRVLWISGDGDVLFEFVNRYSDDEALAVLNAGYLPADYFNVDMAAPCER